MKKSISLQIYVKEIPRKVVFLKIFLHWCKCTNYSLYDMIFFSPKIQLEMPFIHCTWDSNWMPKWHWKYYTMKSCIFCCQHICSVRLAFSPVVYAVAWPLWWSFVDVSQQGTDFSRKIRKKEKNDMTFNDFHMGGQKVSKSNFHLALGILAKLVFWSIFEQ